MTINYRMRFPRCSAKRAVKARCDQRLPIGESDFPQSGYFVEIERGDPSAVRQIRPHPVFVDAMFEILLNLRRRRIQSTPVRPGLERVAIEMRGNIADRARIGVFPPGTPDAIRLFEYPEIRAALFEQPDRCADTGESGANDQDRRVNQA